MQNIYNIIKSRILTSDVIKRLASGAIWSFTGTAIAKLIVLIASIFCARILGKELFGEFGMVRSTINMFVVLGSAGLGITATKYIAEYRYTQKERVASIYLLTTVFAVVTGLIVTIAILLLADYLAVESLQSPHLTSSLKCGALLLFVTVINASQTGVLSGLENFKSIAINTFIGSVCESFFMLIGAYYYGVFGAVLGFGLGFIAIYIANVISIKKAFKRMDLVVKWNRLNIKDLKVLYKFSLPALLSSIIIPPVYWVIRMMLVNKNGYGELAIYEAADQWKVIILFIPTAVSQIILPILSSLVKTDQTKYWKVLKINILVNAFVALAMVGLVICFSQYIMAAYGSNFENTMPLMILSISTVFTAVGNVVGLAIASKSQMWLGFLFNIVWGIVLVVSAYYLIEKGYGSVGVALSILLAYVIHSFIQIIYLKRLRAIEN